VLRRLVRVNITGVDVFFRIGVGFLGGMPTAWAFSFLIGLLASPLCGAALTFFAAAKKVSKESGLKPLILKRVSWLGGDSGAINGSHRGP
jgi:hypothetical protein